METYDISSMKLIQSYWLDSIIFLCYFEPSEELKKEYDLSDSNVLYVVVSEPLISSQAFSAVAVKVKAGSDIEAMKKEMLENINVRKWICVTAEKVYVTNNEDVIFLVMADADWAKEFYQGFSKYVDNKIGKTLEKTTEEAELPPVIE